jgi:succinate-semialdehyde dehydrogenase/glutarate-semialdehyde dehydrogenase
MAKLASHSPATGLLVGSIEKTRPSKVGEVVGSVARIQPIWAELTLSARARYMDRAADALVGRLDELAELIAREQGKPITEAYTMELVPTLEALRWLAGEGAEALAGERISMGHRVFAAKRARFHYEPLGVVAVIAPWNYSWSIPFSETAFALLAGNGVVLKPSPLTPLIGEQVAETFGAAGFPEGLVGVVQGEGDVGEALITDERVRKVFFTGSVPTGKRVGELCAQAPKGSVLELGGKDALIVCADADLKMAIDGAAWAGFANAGQTCSGVERVYVVSELAGEFTRGLVQKASRLRLGDPCAWDTEIGPMVSAAQFEIVDELVRDAVKAGAQLLTGGPAQPPGLDGHFYAPAVLADVTPEMRIMREEIFGPVVPVVPVADEAEAVRLANESEFGLGASVWTRDRDKGERIAHRIEAGTVWVNDHLFTHGACQCSWGGVKHSGTGRSHAKFGLYECVNVKTITQNAAPVGDLWWYPYDARLGRGLRSLARAMYGPRGERAGAIRESVLALARRGAGMITRR